MGIAENKAIHNTKCRTEKRKHLNWQVVPYGNTKAEIQDMLGVVCIVRNTALAEHICSLHNHFCRLASDSQLNKALKII